MVAVIIQDVGVDYPDVGVVVLKAKHGLVGVCYHMSRRGRDYTE